MSCPPIAGRAGTMCMYLPRPPRAWSRVQAECSVNTTAPSPDAVAVVPLTGEVVPAWQLSERMAQLSKGNVLQYKGNSARLTKQQRYSRIARGLWTNRNTMWATQNPVTGYTNPNTQSLKRVGGSSLRRIAISPASGEVIGETTLPLSVCDPPMPAPVNEVLPTNANNGGGGVNNPVIPPPLPPQPPGDVILPPVHAPAPAAPLVVEDGGSLICSVQANPCTGETKSQPANAAFNLTTDSDVPGLIEALYWNDGIQTWFPKQRVSSNSANKWPYTSTGVPTTSTSAVLPLPPILVSVSVDLSAGLATWNWTQNTDCLPATSFQLYENGILVYTYVSTNTSPTTASGVQSYTITLPLADPTAPSFTFFVTATGQGATSFASNQVEVQVE